MTTTTPTPDLPDAQHTPGPWAPLLDGDDANPKVLGPTGKGIAFAVQRDDWRPGDGIPIKTARANARLMAAAPDLLNALRSLLRHAERMAEVMDEECGIRFRDDGPVSMARDALAKAREVKP